MFCREQVVNNGLYVLIQYYMQENNKQFWIARGALLVLMVGCCLSEGWIEDTALLGGTYVLSLLSFKVLLSFFDLCALLLYELEISL